MTQASWSRRRTPSEPTARTPNSPALVGATLHSQLSPTPSSPHRLNSGALHTDSTQLHSTGLQAPNSTQLQLPFGPRTRLFIAPRGGHSPLPSRRVGENPRSDRLGSAVVVITVIRVYAVLRDPSQPSFLFPSSGGFLGVVFLFVEEGRCVVGAVVEMAWLLRCCGGGGGVVEEMLFV